MIDLSSGLDAARESTVRQRPPLFRYAENFMFVTYDPQVDLGLWLHLGTCPDDFMLWEEQLMIALPEDAGLLWCYSYHRTSQDLKPGGAGLYFRCIEAFKRWHVSFSGVGVRTPNAEMLSGRVRDGRKEMLSIELDIESVAPAWDNHLSAQDGKDRGSMTTQAWASEHYQQLYRACGEVRLADRSLSFDATGMRDHSRGQRGHAPEKFGGHNLWTATFPSGKAFGIQRMWLPDRTPTLNVGFVYIDGEFHHAQVVSPAHYLDRTQCAGEELTLLLRSSRGVHQFRGRTVKTMFTTLERPWGISFGADPRAGIIYAPGFAQWRWDGEEAYGFSERSGAVGE